MSYAYRIYFPWNINTLQNTNDNNLPLFFIALQSNRIIRYLVFGKINVVNKLLK